MKLYFDKKSKDPTYFIQQGYRIGSKTSTRNIKRIGKHSELLAITDDPLAYAKDQVAKFNEEMKNSKVSMDISLDFHEKIKSYMEQNTVGDVIFLHRSLRKYMAQQEGIQHPYGINMHQREDDT